MASKRSILIIIEDSYLAGLYGRKFELDGWRVDIAESYKDGIWLIAKQKPQVVLLQKECLNTDIADGMRELRALPTMQQAKIVLLAKETDREEIQRARNAGADAYLLLGYFVPHEALEKIKELVGDRE